MASERVLIILDDTFDAPDEDIPQWGLDDAREGAGTIHVIAPDVGSRLSVATDDDEPRRALTGATVEVLPVVKR